MSLDEMLARESAELKARPVTSPDSMWVTEAHGIRDATVSIADQVVTVEIPIGAQAPVRCQVFKASPNPGGTLNSVLAERAKHVSYQQVTPTGVAILGGAPAVFVSALYGDNDPNGKHTGALKLALHALPDTTTLCLHDELGYRATFERVSRGFFEAFKLAQPSVEKPNYLEISKTQFDDLDVGFTVTKVITGQNPGSVEHVTQTTMLFPTSPKDLVIDDSYCKLELDANQRLQKGTWLDTQSGAVKLQVTLTRSAGGKYSYEGTIRGKPVQGDLSGSGSVSTPLDTIALLKRRLKTKKPFRDKLLEYLPSVDPSSLVPVVYSHESGAEPGAVSVEFGEQKVLTHVDEHGTTQSATLRMGPSVMRMDRKVREGTL